MEDRALTQGILAVVTAAAAGIGAVAFFDWWRHRQGKGYELDKETALYLGCMAALDQESAVAERAAPPGWLDGAAKTIHELRKKNEDLRYQLRKREQSFDKDTSYIRSLRSDRQKQEDDMQALLRTLADRERTFAHSLKARPNRRRGLT